MSKILVQTLLSSLDPLPADAPLLVGFSGGLDSTVLLHVLANHSSRNRIHVLHLNHGLSPQALQWQQHCQAIAQQWQVAFTAQQVKVENLGGGIEDAARRARMAFFEQFCAQPCGLLLAHHLNDQQETVLLRLMRGAGAKGLAAMLPMRPIGQGYLLRPWLNIAQVELRRYAKQHDLQWVQDPSNQQSQFDRNFLRNEILPKLDQRWPEAAQNMARSARLCRQADSLMADLAQIDLQELSACDGRVGGSVRLAQLCQLSAQRQANLVRHFCHRYGVEPPGFHHWQQVEQQLQIAKGGQSRRAIVTWSGGACAIYDQRLFVLPMVPPSLNQWMLWDGERPLALPGGGGLALVPGGDLHWDGQPLQVGPRQPGLRAHPADRAHSQTLKKLLQERRLEPWLRACVPLIYQHGNLQAVADLWVETRAKSKVAGQGMRIVWHPARVPSPESD